MTTTPFLVSGTVKDREGSNLSNVLVYFVNGDFNDFVVTNSSGQYVYDLANLGYVVGDTISYSCVSVNNDQIVSGSFVVSGVSKSLNLNLVCRTHDERVRTGDNKIVQIGNIGAEVVSDCNPFPVKVITGEGTQTSVDNPLYIREIGKVDNGNSTCTPLLAGATFTGDGIDTIAYSAITILVYANVASAVNGMVAQFSYDNSDWHDGEVYTILASTTKFFTPPVQARYFRIKYTNGGTNQTSFHIHTMLKPDAVKWSSHNIDDPIKDEDDAQLVKAVITGKRVDGDYDNLALTNGNNVKVSLEELETGVSSNSNSQLNVTSFHADGTEGVLITGVDYVSGKSGIDSATETLQNIMYEHHEVHSGNHYFICDYQTLGNAAVVDFTVVTPNTTTWSHMTFSLVGTQAITFQVYEGATVDVVGTAVTAINNNRNLSNTTSLTIRTGDTFTSTGTKIRGDYLGSGRVGGVIERDREIILKQNTTYIFRITNTQATDTVVVYDAEWYENVNKN